MTIELHDIQPDDKNWVQNFLRAQADDTRMVSRGVLHQCDALPGFIADYEGVPSALLTYQVKNNELEVITLYSARSSVGLGTRLLEAARERAEQLGCRRLWLITTNDNEPAIQFYERRGLKLAAVHRNALTESRKLKPEIPFFGLGGKPIEDELEFELRL